MERRTLLRLIGVAILPLFRSRLLGRDKNQSQFTHSGRDVVLDQSGNFGHGRFVVGILTCSNAAGATVKMKRLRGKFRCRLRYNSRNKWKANYAKSLIDYWLDSSSIYVRVRAIERTSSKGRETPSDQERRYINQLVSLLNMRPNTRNTSRLITQRRSWPNHDNNVDKDLIKRSRNIIEVRRIKDKDSDLIQLLDLIVGTIYGSQGGPSNWPDNKTKRELVAYMQSKLGTKSLWSPIQHPKFVVEIVSEA